MGKYILITNYNNIDDLNKAIDNCVDIIINSDYKLNEDIKIVTVSNYEYENKNITNHIVSDGNHHLEGMKYIKSIDNDGIIMFFDSDDIMYKNKLKIFDINFNKYGYVTNYLKSFDGVILKNLKGYFSGITINIKFYDINFLSQFNYNGFDSVIFFYAVENNIKRKQKRKIYNGYTINSNSLSRKKEFKNLLNNTLIQCRDIFKNKKTIHYLDFFKYSGILWDYKEKPYINLKDLYKFYNAFDRDIIMDLAKLKRLIIILKNQVGK